MFLKETDSTGTPQSGEEEPPDPFTHSFTVITQDPSVLATMEKRSIGETADYLLRATSTRYRALLHTTREGKAARLSAFCYAPGEEQEVDEGHRIVYEICDPQQVIYFTWKYYPQATRREVSHLRSKIMDEIEHRLELETANDSGVERLSWDGRKIYTPLPKRRQVRPRQSQEGNSALIYRLPLETMMVIVSTFQADNAQYPTPDGHTLAIAKAYAFPKEDPSKLYWCRLMRVQGEGSGSMPHAIGLRHAHRSLNDLVLYLISDGKTTDGQLLKESLKRPI